MEPLTITLIVAAIVAVAAAVFFLGAHFAPGRAKVLAEVEATEVKSFQAVISETMLAWQAAQAKRAQALAVEQAALAADAAAFAATQKAIAAMASGTTSVPAQP